MVRTLTGCEIELFEHLVLAKVSCVKAIRNGEGTEDHLNGVRRCLQEALEHWDKFEATNTKNDELVREYPKLECV